MILELSIAVRSIIADRTAEILFGLEGAKFDFLAGQYVRITVTNTPYEDARGNSREFSIASSPREKKYLKIAFRASESGFKKNIMEAPLGAKVKVEGPFGVFTLPACAPHADRPKDFQYPIVFIAGGIGITPFLSMATFAAEEKLPNKITLLYTNSSLESATYLDILKELETKNLNFHLRGKIGFLDDSFIAENTAQCIQSDSSCLWYIAGPAGMVYEARQTLLRRNVDEKDIYTEEFSGYEPNRG